jgi:branched-chain amino acid transport system ATP-binding protein
MGQEQPRQADPQGFRIMNSVLSVSDLTVAFGGAKALDGASLVVKEGEVHGLIGPNGAGKTTLLNAITGFLTPASGRILLDGQPLPSRPHLVARAGVARTFQSVGSFPELSAIQNVLTLCDAGRPRRDRPASSAQALRAAHELLDLVEFSSPRDVPVENLSFASHRKVEIARALFARPRLLLMDEPTAGLERAEVTRISEILKKIVAQRICSSVVLIEHNVQFVFTTSDTVTALDQGRTICSGTPGEVRSDAKVVESYLGRDAHDVQEHAARPAVRYEEPRAEAAKAHNATSPGQRIEARKLVSGYGRTKVLKGIDFAVEPGETVLVYGRNGAGKSTLLNTLAGQPRASSGEVFLGERRISGLPVSDAVNAGLGLVPQGGGVLTLQTVLENLQVSITGLHLSAQEFMARKNHVFDLFPILADRSGFVAGRLSGGQRQMLALAKVLMREPSVLLLDEPSIGLAPAVVDELSDILRVIIGARSVGVVIAEQNIRWVASIASRGVQLDNGSVVRVVGQDELQHPEQLMATYLT